jgi:hypothetical protein
MASTFDLSTRMNCFFETPAAAPMTQQIEAISCALHSVLAEYRGFIAQGANL